MLRSTALLALLAVATPAMAQTTIMPAFSPAAGSVTAPKTKPAPAPRPFLAAPFSDHMVLQHDAALTLWGWAPHKTGIVATLDGSTAKARADRNGRWQLKLPPHKAGGPYTLYVTGSDGRDVQLTDVMLGDVWLCSGQSNMEFELRKVTGAEQAVAGATDADIRLLQVPVASADQPSDAFAHPIAWTRTSPAAAANFSAACFFMGREIARAEKLTVGLIDASRGGSAITPWISADALRKLDGYDRGLGALSLHAKSPDRAEEAYRLQMEDWWTRAGDNAPAASDFDDSAWPTTPATEVWEGWDDPALARFDGVVWYRTSVDLTPEQVKGAAMLALGPVDDVDQTSVNGEVVGSTRGWDAKRTYRLREGLLKPGRNVIVVRALDTGGGGGLYGDPSARSITFADGTVLPIAGPWRWQRGPALAELGRTPVLPWDEVTGLTTLYNGMIAPLGAYALKGFAWYQGETDVGAEQPYAKLLPALVADWRDRFGAKPFLIVQLAGYGPPASRPSDPAIARLREVQRRAAAADPAAAIATAVDIGDWADIHPTNKLELGRRLGLAARQVAYGEAIDGSGPKPLAASQSGDVVSVSFDSAGSALEVHGNARPVGFELCGASGCHFADADLDGTIVRIHADGPATRVRYLWAESPVVNLYDAHGLPALPFELPVIAAPASAAAGQAPPDPAAPAATAADRP